MADRPDVYQDICLAGQNYFYQRLPDIFLLSDAFWMGSIIMRYPIRILQVVTTMNRGGLETMLMNYYRYINRSKVQFDFLVHRDFEADYD